MFENSRILKIFTHDLSCSDGNMFKKCKVRNWPLLNLFKVSWDNMQFFVGMEMIKWFYKVVIELGQIETMKRAQYQEK